MFNLAGALVTGQELISVVHSFVVAPGKVTTSWKQGSRPNEGLGFRVQGCGKNSTGI